jgi:hypothetical protein
MMPTRCAEPPDSTTSGGTEGIARNWLVSWNRCTSYCGSGERGGGVMAPADLPTRSGPCEFGQLGAWVAVHCPRELAPLMRNAGGQWEPGTRRWLIEWRRISPVIRTLRRQTDPLFPGERGWTWTSVSLARLRSTWRGRGERWTCTMSG